VVDDVAVTLLFQTIITEAADVYVDFDWLLFTDSLATRPATSIVSMP